MFFLKYIAGLAACIILDLIFTEKAFAWGPGIHTATVLSTLSDASALLPSIANIITSFPREYLYGCLSADFFVGKSKRKNAGHPHNWEGGFRFLSEAGRDREAAFAYGFITHLAADVAAHNIFIPNLINSWPAHKKIGHLYWELRADYIIGPAYTKFAKKILGMDNRACDDLITLTARKSSNKLKANKLLYSNSVRISDYFFSTRNFLFSGPNVRGNEFNRFLGLMIDLSCRLVKDILSNPSKSCCLLYEPMGSRDLHLTNSKKLFKKIFNTSRPSKALMTDRNYFEA